MSGKWFRSARDDDDDDEEEDFDDERSEKSDASEDSDDKSDKSSDDDDDDDSDESDDSDEDSDEKSDESDDEDKPKTQQASRFLKKKDADLESDSEDDRPMATAAAGRKGTRVENVRELIHDIREAFQSKNVGELSEHIPELIKMITRVRGDRLPKAFMRAAAVTERVLKEMDEKAGDDDDDEGEKRQQQKKKQQAKQFPAGSLRQKLRKALIQFKDEYDEFKRDYEVDLEESDEESDDDDDDEDEGRKGKDDMLLGKKQAKKAKELAEESEREWKADLIERKLAEVLAMRGRKGTEKQDTLDGLKKILQHTFAPHHKFRIQILSYVVAATFDMAPTGTNFMKADKWQAAYDSLVKLVSVLSEMPHFVMVETADDLNEPNPSKADEDNKVVCDGNLMSYLERLDDEYIKALQLTDPHTQEYLSRLTDEGFLMDAAERVFHYYYCRNMFKHAARIATRLLDHLYYRRQDEHKRMMDKQRQQTKGKKQKGKEAAAVADDALSNEDVKDEDEAPSSSLAPMTKKYVPTLTDKVAECVVKYIAVIMKHGDEKSKSRAILCKVYHLALHDKFTEARDIVLMSHIQDILPNAIPSFQVLFNRCLAQLGLAAFRLGQYRDVHVALNDLCASMRVKELLAQGYTLPKYQQDRKADQEKLEKLKLMPFHTHINLEVLEAAHLVSAMLQEAAPTMAANQYDTKKRPASKAYNKLMSTYEAQVFVGPPESTRDHINAATKALVKGNWSECNTLVLKLPAWDMMPNGDKIKTMLTNRIKEESLRAYLLQYSQFYETISLQALQEKYELPKNTAHALISKMMSNEEINGSWDQPAGCIRIHRTNPPKLQYLCSVAADKVQGLVEYNERVMDSRAGSAFGGQTLAGYRQGGRGGDRGEGGQKGERGAAAAGGAGGAESGFRDQSDQLRPGRPTDNLWGGGNFARFPAPTPGNQNTFFRRLMQQTGGQRMGGGGGGGGGYQNALMTGASAAGRQMGRNQQQQANRPYTVRAFQ